MEPRVSPRSDIVKRSYSLEVRNGDFVLSVMRTLGCAIQTRMLQCESLLPGLRRS